jgi:1D-myo-inositol 3-kinase
LDGSGSSGGGACEILVAGNYCHDTLLGKDGREHRVLGGSAAYLSAVLRACGVRVRTVAKVGADFRYRSEVAEAPVIEGERSTAFLDDYRSGERRETLESAGPRIRPEDVDVRCSIAIACGVAGEVLPETLARLRARSGLLLADAQGLCRVFGEGGAVGIALLRETPFAGVLHHLDHLKLGAAEKAAVDPAGLRATLLFTDGPRGCDVLGPPDPSGARASAHVAPFPAEERDATGAGDCFLAGYAAGLLRGLSPERAARVGNYCGARAVECVGVPRLDPAALLALLDG